MTGVEYAAAVAAGMFGGLLVLAVWSSWVMRKHRGDGRLCCDCRNHLALDGVRYCKACEKVRVAQGTAQIDAAIARGQW